MNKKKQEDFQIRLFEELNNGMSCLVLELGYRLGLIQTLASEGAMSSSELAGYFGYSERYVHEWLEAMAAGEYLAHDAISDRFSLPPAHAEVLVEPNSPYSAIGTIGWVTSMARILPNLMVAFNNGGGVPFKEYGQEIVTAQSYENRPKFVNYYVNTWIPTMPDIENKLKDGGRVAEIGCGTGWSSIALAKGFGNISIDAIDPDEPSINEAKINAAIEEVAERIDFHLSTIEEAELEGPYDLVTAFECLHDLPYPIQALNRMRELAGQSGAVLVADVAVGETLEENTNFFGHICYNFSVLHCLPQAMDFPHAAATGTVIKPSIVRRYAEKAGFTEVEILPIEGPWRFYRLIS
jgi:2-polyprenyl-3-methyl-5-hydroxy-6-metoxy-1,4-benzoquinol methylase